MAGGAGAKTIFESDGSSMEGWETQWHPTIDVTPKAPIWESDGKRIKGAAFYSKFLDRELGGTAFNTNPVSMKVGDVATFTMDLEGVGIIAPDNRNHWWAGFGLRTGGTQPWEQGDVAAAATFRTGSGTALSSGFTLWNTWSDAAIEPYPRCDIASDGTYRGGPVFVSFSVERTESGFGPSLIITSNHVSGVQHMAVATVDQLNQNNCASSNLFFFLQMPAEFDGPGGYSTLGSHVYVSNMKLVIDQRSLFPLPVFNNEVSEDAGTQPLQCILDIKQLSIAQAEQQNEAMLKGQVINLHPRQNWLFVHDGQEGIYIELDKPVNEFAGLQVGSEIRVEGVTRSGTYSPILFATTLKVLSQKPLPRAQQLSRALRRSTTTDIAWVEVWGRPVSMEYVESFGHFLISLEVFRDGGAVGEVLEVFIPDTDDVYQKMKPFMFQLVQVSGVIGTRANHQKQMTRRVLFVNSLDDFSLVPGFGGNVPQFFPIHEFLQYGTDSYGLGKTRGTITSATKDTLYLRNEKGTLKAAIFQEEKLSPGDVVELVGYVHMQSVSPAFRTVSAKLLERGLPPKPVDIQLNRNTIDPGWNYEFVSIDATFVYEEKSFTSFLFDASEEKYQDVVQQTLWCLSDSRLVEARLPAGVPLVKNVRQGSRLRLTGICHVSESKSPRLDQVTGAFWLELSNESSIEIIRQASWWTAQRLIWGISVVLIILLIMGGWVIALHKVVSAQTNTIGQQIKTESVLSERQRIARELHDTVEQGLTALSLQLGRVMNKTRKSSPDDLPVVEKAVNALRVCQEESRASIKDLRGGLLEKMDLPSAVRETIASRLDESAVVPEVEVEGEIISLTLFIEHQIVRIITEATLNAVHHGSPSSVKIILRYMPDSFHADIIDDGSGFKIEEIKTLGRFGVLGMQERAKRMNSELEIESNQGTGTRISLAVPLVDATMETRYE